jgi:diguanylate cyclase (GGDEF)-like protein
MALYSYSSIAALIVYIILIALILKKGYRESLYRSMAIYLGAMAYWQMTSLFVSVSHTPEQALFWYRLMTIGPGVVFIFFFSFVKTFRNDPRRDNLQNLGHFIVILVILAGLLKGHYLVPAVKQHPGTGLFIPADFGVLIYAYLAVGMFFTGMAIWDLARDYRSSKNEEHRSRIRYLLVGVLLVFAGGLANFDVYLRGYPIDIVANLSHAVLITYAIIRHRLLNIKLVLRTGLLYSTLTITISVFYLLLMFTIKTVFSDLSGFSTYTAAIIVAFLIAIFFNSLRERFQESIDRLIWGNRYEYYQMMRDFATASVSLISLDNLVNKLTEMIHRTLQVGTVALFLKEMDGDSYRIWSCRGKESEDMDLAFGRESHLVRWMALRKRPLQIRDVYLLPQLHGLWKTELESLAALNVEMLFPLLFKDNLIGFLTVSSHFSGRSVSEQEKELLKLFANQVAVAVNNALYFERVRKLSITDPLTGTYNRRFFNEAIEREKEKLKDGGTLGLIMLDVFNFKSYNDRYGHPSGDLLLKELANILHESIRASDIVVRYGGDEFSILLPAASLQTSHQVAGRIREKLEQWNQKQGLKLFGEKVTVTMGIYSVDYQEVDNLVKLADKELYLARESEERRNMLRSLESLGKDRQKLSLEMVLGLARAVEIRDPYTRGHSERVSELAIQLGKAMGLQGPEIENLGYAALLHDLGKIAVPRSILQKKGGLTAEEMRVVQEHTAFGEEIVQEINLLRDTAPLIRHHHERFDGYGYPNGLKGEEIPLGSRILAVVDSYDAMLSTRPYRSALTFEETVAELRENAGTQFDPEVVFTFCNLIDKGVYLIKGER